MPPEQSLLPERNNSQLVEGALGFLITHQEVEKSKFFKASEETEQIIASNDEKLYKERMNRAMSYNFEPVTMSKTIQSILSQQESRNQGGAFSPNSSSPGQSDSKSSTTGSAAP